MGSKNNSEQEKKILKQETKIQNQIKIALSEAGCIVHRMNVGTFFTMDGRKVHIGTVGHSDLYGHRPDGKAFYIEVKTQTGHPTKEQEHFLDVMQKTGAISGIARSPDDALKIVFEGQRWFI